MKNIDEKGTPVAGLSEEFATPAAMPLALNLANLSLLPDAFIKPRYNPADVTTSILHIGPSNFFRSHFAKFIHERLNLAADKGEPLDMGIRAISLNSPSVRDNLKDHDNLYTVTQKGLGSPTTHEIIGSVRDVIFSEKGTPKQEEGHRGILKAFADPNIRLITMTITQKGYEYNGSKDKDLKRSIKPDTLEDETIGVIAHGLKIRFDLELPPPMIMSLDNINGNGTVLRNAVTHYASAVDPKFGQWVKDNVPFPNTMVDRITPKPTAAHVAEIAAMGVKEASPVLAEPMPALPLVIDDMSEKPGMKGQAYRASGVMELAKVDGPIFSAKVGKYETMKLRMLNGAHFALGCAAHLLGIEENDPEKYATSDRAMKDPTVRRFISTYIDQAIGTLESIEGVDFRQYKSELMNRLDNPFIFDPVTRLARNGISKVGDRLLTTITDATAQGKPHDMADFTSAAWLHYISKLTPDGFLKAGDKEANEKDAKETGFVAAVINNGQSINAVFDFHKIWTEALAKKTEFVTAVEGHHKNIEVRGVRSVLESLTDHDNALNFAKPGVQPTYVIQ